MQVNQNKLTPWTAINSVGRGITALLAVQAGFPASRSLVSAHTHTSVTLPDAVPCADPNNPMIPPSQELRSAFLREKASRWYHQVIPEVGQQKAEQEVIEYAEKAIASHNIFLKKALTELEQEGNCLPADAQITLLETAFPRFHSWTALLQEKGIVHKDIDIENLAGRIQNASPEEFPLWEQRQRFIAKQSLKFLMKKKILNPEHHHIIADVMAETGLFAHFANEKRSKNGDKMFQDAYSVDADPNIIKIGQIFGNTAKPMNTNIFDCDAKPSDKVVRCSTFPKLITYMMPALETKAPKADFVYISAPFFIEEHDPNKDEELKLYVQSIKSFINQDNPNAKIFMGLSVPFTADMIIYDATNNQNKLPTQDIKNFIAALSKEFDVEIHTAKSTGSKRLIADTYSGFLLLSPKKQPDDTLADQWRNFRQKDGEL
jgi:hypothetical protein